MMIMIMLLSVVLSVLAFDDSGVMLQTKNLDGAQVATIGVLQSLDEVRSQIAQTHNMTPSEKTTFTSLIGTMVDSYKTELQNEHNADEALWTSEAGKHSQCQTNSQLHFSVGGNVHTSAAQVISLRLKHKMCSKASKAWSVYNEAGDGGDTALFMQSTASHDHLYATMTTMRSAVAGYKSTPPVSTSVPESCTSDQQSFENAVCNEHTAKLLACNTETECLSIVDLSTTKTTLGQKSETRRAQKLNLLTNKCKMLHMLEQIGKVADDLADTCDATTKLDDADLVLTMTIPASQNCGGVEAVLPSSETCVGFRTHEYESWSPDHVVPQQCLVECNPVTCSTHSCGTGSLVGVASGTLCPVAGCTDASCCSAPIITEPAPATDSTQVMNFIGQGWCANANGESFSYAKPVIPDWELLSEDSCKNRCLTLPACVGLNSDPTETDKANGNPCVLFLVEGTEATADMAHIPDTGTYRMPGGTNAWDVISPQLGWASSTIGASGPITQVRPTVAHRRRAANQNAWTATGGNSGKCFAKAEGGGS